MTNLSRVIAVKPIIKYPREAQVGKTYLLTIDLQPDESFEWHYDEEEYPIYCNVDSDLFSSKPVGEPVVVLHRFGGSYGSSKFLLTALSKARECEIKISLINSWGVLIKQFNICQITITDLILNQEEFDIKTTKINRLREIIKGRQSLASNFEGVHRKLSALYSKLQELEEYQQQLIQKLPSQVFSEKLRNIFLDENKISVSEKIREQHRIIKRFSRETINIGVIGTARQGKSRLIQSLSGIGSDVIPANDREICTAVCTTVYHNSQTETFAKVWFHSEDSFLKEVIQPYYEKLELGSSPETLKDFANTTLPVLPPPYRTDYKSILYEELCKYHRHFDKYKSLLNIASPQMVSHQQIRDFVAQDVANNDYNSFNYPAVKEVEVLSPFSNQNATSLAFIDIPGMGYMNIGQEENFLRVLQDDVDIVLFVRKPDLIGDAWRAQDLELYDIVNQAMPSPLMTCSFMILNRTKGDMDNISVCENFAIAYTTRKHMNFIDCIIADCIDRAEVNQKILDPLIDFLTQNISKIDEQFVLSYKNELIELQDHIASILTEAKLALNDSDSLVSSFTELFHDFWQRLTSSLQSFLNEQKLGNHPSNYVDIQASISELIYGIKNNSIVPSLETVEQHIAIQGSYNTTYVTLLSRIRSELSRRFLELDEVLKEISEVIKSSMSEILIEQINLFNPPNLLNKKGTEFLRQLTELVPQNAKNLKLGIQNLSDFNITYSIFLQPRIRECLNRFYPDNNTSVIQAENAREVHDALETIYYEALDSCEQSLIDISQELNHLFCAVVEEFIDRIIRAEGVENEWASFLYQNRNAIVESIENWQRSIAEVEMVNADIAR